MFKVAFIHRIMEKGAPTTLLNVFQREKETLWEYMVYFAVAVQGMDGIEDLTVMMTLSSGLKGSQYTTSQSSDW